jgi:hypothetical protein
LLQSQYHLKFSEKAHENSFPSTSLLSAFSLDLLPQGLDVLKPKKDFHSQLLEMHFERICSEILV